MFAISLRIPVSQYIPLDLKGKRLFINVSASSSRPLHVGDFLILNENCRDAEIIGCNRTSRPSTDFNYNLG